MFFVDSHPSILSHWSKSSVSSNNVEWPFIAFRVNFQNNSIFATWKRSAKPFTAKPRNVYEDPSISDTTQIDDELKKTRRFLGWLNKVTFSEKTEECKE